MRYPRNEQGLTKRQALFVAYGGMDCPRTAASRAKKSRARKLHATPLSVETREQLALIEKYFKLGVDS